LGHDFDSQGKQGDILMGKVGTLLLTILLLSGQSVGASPFSQATPEFAASSECRFQQVYSSYKADYVWFNILEKLFPKLPSTTLSANEFQSLLAEAMDETLQVCGENSQRFYDIDSFSSYEQSEGALRFELFDKSHQIVIEEEGVNTQFIYQQYFPNTSQYVTFMHSRKQLHSYFSHRLLGRIGDEHSNQRYYLLYSPQGDEIVRQQAINLNINSQDYQSLEDIYGKNYLSSLVTDPKVMVGVIGSGVDYNHPKIARHLVGRESFENEVVELIELKEKVTSFPYRRFDELVADITRLEEQKDQVGFPQWMDQALGTHRPFDQVIPRMPNRDPRHETTMAGRIVVNQGSIGLVSVRKAYGYAPDEDLSEIFENFERLGVRVVNMSYAYECGDNDPFEEQWRAVFSRYPDIIVVTAAGNDGANVDEVAYCPARYSRDYPQVISVTAVGGNDELAHYNNISVNYGETVTVASYADNLSTFHPFGSEALNNESGASSMATAETTRMIVEAIAKDLPVTAQNVKEHLEDGGVPNANLAGYVSVPAVLNQELFEQSYLPAFSSLESDSIMNRRYSVLSFQ
jgi:subtilisin family serine protease